MALRSSPFQSATAYPPIDYPLSETDGAGYTLWRAQSSHSYTGKHKIVAGLVKREYSTHRGGFERYT